MRPASQVQRAFLESRCCLRADQSKSPQKYHHGHQSHGVTPLLGAAQAKGGATALRIHLGEGGLYSAGTTHRPAHPRIQGISRTLIAPGRTEEGARGESAGRGRNIMTEILMGAARMEEGGPLWLSPGPTRTSTVFSRYYRWEQTRPRGLCGPFYIPVFTTPGLPSCGRPPLPTVGAGTPGRCWPFHITELAPPLLTVYDRINPRMGYIQQLYKLRVLITDHE